MTVGSRYQEHVVRFPEPIADLWVHPKLSNRSLIPQENYIRANYGSLVE
jgi:hypothetical protein